MCDYCKIVDVKYNGQDVNEEVVFSFVVPCGKCYDCKRELSNQFVLRCRSEYMHTVSSFFVTLTYNDKNIRYFAPYDRVSRAKELDYISKMPGKYFGMYKNFVLDKNDASRFCSLMQKSIKRFSPTLLFRYVLNGEYGMWTQRPHYHALVFSPLFFNLQDFKMLVDSCWQFGNVTVSEVTDSRINYVAKHFMKSDVGSEIQQLVSPIFQKRSIYKGGVGRDLVNDTSLLVNYERDLDFFQIGKYKMSIPRYIRKKLHPEKQTFDELLELSKKSYDNLVSRIASKIIYIDDDSLKLTRISDSKDRLRYAVQILRDNNYDLVVNKLRDFYTKKFWEHYNKLKNKEILL